MQKELSLGHTFLESNQLQGIPVVTLNYVNPDYRLVLPSPDGDWYLRNTAVPAVRCGEFVVVTRLIDGLRSYYTRLGLIPNRATIEEVEPTINGEVMYGFPFTDPLSSMEGRYFRGSTLYYLVSTFYGKLVSDQMVRLNLCSLQRPDSVITNNKAELRRFAEIYGYAMFSGMLIQNNEDLTLAEENFRQFIQGGWLKFPTGSGGDLVRFRRDLSVSSIRDGIMDLRSAVLRAFQKGNFEGSAEEFWPEGSLIPNGFPIVLEADARNYGEVLINGSTQFVTSKTGEVRLIGHFSQITTPEGEYLGNRPYFPEDQLEYLISEQVMRVAQYNIHQNGYFGIQGVDWFVIRNNQGRVVRVVELNSRPTANTPPVIIADKLNVYHWINTNVYTDRQIRGIRDYIEIIGEELAYGEVNREGLVIPQSFRTLVTERAVFSSSDFKVLIMGRSEEHCGQIMQRLNNRGVRFHS